MNPRTATHDLLPFQGSPFSHLGTSPKCLNLFYNNGEGGIRTHAPFRTNGFQDRLVMTTSIPLHIFFVVCRTRLAQRQLVFYHSFSHVSIHNLHFFIFFSYANMAVLHSFYILCTNTCATSKSSGVVIFIFS